MSDKPHADIGIFGGSGFYSLLENPRKLWVETPYGPTSDKISLAELGGKTIAFLPRHGADHRLPPGQIPYRANIWAMKELGIKHIIAPGAVGSLQPDIHPGDFVICDQFIDRTNGRADTFYEGPGAVHISSADPYCPTLRALAYEIACEMQLSARSSGTVVTIRGPRFSSRAESRWFRSIGGDVISMTAYPECILARELEMCYVNISLVTDYDAGLDGIAEPVSSEEVGRVFAENTEKIKKLTLALAERIDLTKDCSCHHALLGARL